MTDHERFVCGFCKTPAGEDRGEALDEVLVRTEVAGEVAMFACGHCGAILGFASCPEK